VVLVAVPVAGVVVEVVVGAPLAVVVGAVAVTLVVGGGEVNVGPAEAGKPTVPALLGCCFGAGGAARWRLAGLALRADVVVGAGGVT
jgi:hypothetical protein